MLPIPRSPSEAAVLATSTSSPSPPGTAWRPVVPASPAIDQGLKWKYHNYIHSVYNYNNILYIYIYIYICMYVCMYVYNYNILTVYNILVGG